MRRANPNPIPIPNPNPKPTPNQSLIESNCLPRVVSLMGRAGVELPKAALRVCANVATGDDAQAQAVVDAGALPAMRELLKQPDKVRARG